MSRISSLLMAICIILATLSGCADNSQAEVKATTEAQASSEASSEESTEPSPDIEAVDYQGRDFIIAYYVNEVWPCVDVFSEGLNGEVLNDAVYNRNNEIAEKYNINIKTVSEKSIETAVKRSVMAGDNHYDLVLSSQGQTSNMLQGGLLTDLNTLGHLDFSKPWWKGYFIKDTSISGKNFFALSDLNISGYDATPIVLFNKQIIKDNNLEEPYGKVLDGSWTLDAFKEMCKGVSRDVDGNDVMDENDMYGGTANNFAVDCFLFGTDTRFIKKDAQDMPYLDIDNGKLAGVMEKITGILSDKTNFLLAEKPFVTDREESPKKAFVENRSLFFVSLLQVVSMLRDMETDFGILPMPKYDDAQEDYTSFVHVFTGTVTSVPAQVSDTDCVGRVLEDMVYLSYRDVMPAYYETNLVGKFTRDEESAAMLDIIFDSYVCDLSNVLMRNAGFSLVNELRNFATDSTKQVSALLESKMDSYKKSVDKVNAAISAVIG